MITLLLVLILLLPCRARALEPFTTGSAGVHDLGVKSAAALEWNPAVLGAHRGFRWSLELPSVAGALANNSFSVRYWNDHIAGDRYLSEAAKNDILHRIPGDGLRADAHVTAPVLGFTYNRFATRVVVHSANAATLPRDLAEIALKGYELNRLYDVGSPVTESLTFVDVGLGFGYQFDQDYVPDLHFGAGFHYYHGLSLAKLAEADANLMVSDTTITGHALFHFAESTHGDGVGFDLGAYAVLSPKWEVGLAFRQLGARMAWRVDDNKLINLYADSLGPVPDSLRHDGYLERWSNYEETHYTGGSLETPLPVVIHANARWSAHARCTMLGEMQITAQESAFGKAGVQAGVATEYRPLKFLPLQLGLSTGGTWGTQLGLGAGVRTSRYELMLGWTAVGLLESGEGYGVGLTQRLKF